MKTVCAWCSKEKTTIEHHYKGLVTHTICEDCAEMVRKEMEDLYGKPALEPLDTYQLIKH